RRRVGLKVRILRRQPRIRIKDEIHAPTSYHGGAPGRSRTCTRSRGPSVFRTAVSAVAPRGRNAGGPGGSCTPKISLLRRARMLFRHGPVFFPATTTAGPGTPVFRTLDRMSVRPPRPLPEVNDAAFGGKRGERLLNRVRVPLAGNRAHHDRAFPFPF